MRHRLSGHHGGDGMNIDAFYSAASALCFTLLGFWWVVVQFRHNELTHDPGPRRFAFLLRRFISSCPASRRSLHCWRTQERCGASRSRSAASRASRRRRCRSRAHPWLVRRGGRSAGPRGLARPSTPAVLLIAAVPSIAREQLQLEPLQVEGFLLIGIVLVGILLAWWLFMDPDMVRTGARSPGLSDARESLHPGTSC